MVGQPKNGNRDTVKNLTVKDVQSHIENTFCGQNFSVVATGNVSHDKIVEAASKWLNKLPETTPGNLEEQSQKPYLTPTMMSQRDDERDNLNCAVSFLVPGVSDSEHLGMLMYQEIMGNYNANEDGMAHVNTPQKQYNYFHRRLGERPGVNLQRTQYYGFSDFGVFTMWMHGHEIYSHDILYHQQWQLGQASRHLNQVEVYRARARWFNNLLNQSPSTSLNLEIANQTMFSGRRIGRAEMAQRLSEISDAKLLKKYATKWFFDKDIGCVAYGNTKHLIGIDNYNQRLMNSTRGDFLQLL